MHEELEQPLDRRARVPTSAGTGVAIWFPRISQSGDWKPRMAVQMQDAAILLAVLLDDRFHETGIDETGSMELEGCWWIPRLRLAERGAVSWQDGVKRSRWR